MFISQPKGTVIGNIYRNDATKHDYNTVKSHYSSAEFNNGFERWKATLDIENLHKRLLKLMTITTLSNVYLYLGKMQLLHTSSQFDVFLNKSGDIVWGGIGYVSPINTGKTLSNINTQNTTIEFVGKNNNIINYYYNDTVPIAAYNVNEDTVEILKSDSVDCINNFNAFLTQHCNKTLRVAVVIDNKIEIMEISY